MEGSVFQEWFTRNGWKMQSIFVNGLRAPIVGKMARGRWMT